MTQDAGPSTPTIRRVAGSRLATDVVLDVSLEELEADPYPTYAWLREHAPVAYVPRSGRVFVTTWDLCDEAGLNDTVFEPAKGIFNTVYGEPNVISLNGEPHRVIRGAINAPFRPRTVNAYRDSGLRATAARYIDAAAERCGSAVPAGTQVRADATREILEPISQRAIGDVLGFTDVDDATLSRWFHDYADYLVDFGRSEQVAERGRAAKAEVVAYLERRTAELADVPQPDGSAMWHMLHDGMPAGQVRPVHELIGSFGVLIVGGFQEPAHGVANTLLGLLGRTRPGEPDDEQPARVRSDPAAWSTAAIDEGLRWLSPFGMTEKVLRTDATLGGLDLPEGTEVGLMIGSANRDPSRFADPDVFDLDRPRLAHAAFGYGTHFCIGHSVARALGQVVLEELFSRLPGLRLDPDRAPVVHGWAARGATSLPVVWDA
jgi:cytochrome P450